MSSQSGGITCTLPTAVSGLSPACRLIMLIGNINSLQSEIDTKIHNCAFCWAGWKPEGKCMTANVCCSEYSVAPNLSCEGGNWWRRAATSFSYDQAQGIPSIWVEGLRASLWAPIAWDSNYFGDLENSKDLDTGGKNVQFTAPLDVCLRLRYDFCFGKQTDTKCTFVPPDKGETLLERCHGWVYPQEAQDYNLLDKQTLLELS